MATVLGSLQSFGKLENESWVEHDARTTKLMEVLQEQSDNLPDGKVVGGIISFPIADGRAIYQVIKEKPLQLAHVAFSDGWQADPITIRGLKLEDVKLMLKRSKAMPRLKPLLHIPSPQAAVEALASKKAISVEAASKDVDVNKRFNDAIENADIAFWAVIADSYPEIKSGDLGPDVVIPFTRMMEKAVAEWLKANVPEGTDIVNLVHSDFVTGNDDKAELVAVKPARLSEFPSQKVVASIKETYPVGTRIILDSMPDDPDPLPEGTQGTVVDVDDVGQLVMKWDNNRSLSLIPGVDQFRIIKTSFEDFLATKKWSDDIEKEIGFDNGAGKIKGYIYRDFLHIQQLDDGSYFLPIGRDEYTSPKLEGLEKTLYDQHFSLIED